jgi:hypothetical protein
MVCVYSSRSLHTSIAANCGVETIRKYRCSVRDVLRFLHPEFWLLKERDFFVCDRSGSSAYFHKIVAIAGEGPLAMRKTRKFVPRRVCT